MPDHPHGWSNGANPLPLPPGFPLGAPSDFQFGLTRPDDVYVGRLRYGIPEVCWTAHGFPLIDPQDAFATESCCLRIAYARVIELLYDAQFDRVRDFFVAWLGVGVTISRFAQDGVIPAAVLVKSATFAIVVLSGTDNYQQWVCQAADGGLPPMNIGGINSLPFWGRTADWYFTELTNLGVSNPLPVMLVGHSYGAAVVSIMAGRMHRAHPTRRIGLLTFAAPKLGDQAFIDLLHEIRPMDVVNDGDLVAAIPPDLVQCLWFGGLIGGALAQIWNRWTAKASYLRYDADGNSRQAGPQTLTYDLLLPAVLRLVVGLPANLGTPHTIPEYLRRMRINCHGPCWPVPANAWAVLFGVADVGLVIGADLGAIAAAGLVIEGPIIFPRKPDTELVIGPEVEIAPDVGLIVGADLGELPDVGLIVGPTLEPSVDVGLIVGPTLEPSVDVGLIVGADLGELPDVGMVVGVTSPADTDLLIGEDPPLIPGDTCADALALPLGTTFSYVTNDHDFQWYMVAVPAGTTFHVRLDFADTGWEPSFVRVGTDCASAFIRSTFFSSGACFDDTEGSDCIVYFSVSNTVLPVNYTFTWGVGTC